MPMYINTNVTSLSTQMQLNKSQMASQTAMTRLSSGLRINSAADDAAGLAISDRMSAQVTGLNQAVRNANDGISLAQTAGGALSQITNSLQRLRELSVQSSNATNTASDRAALQQEAGQLLQEIDRVSGQTQFNGIKLLDGSFKQQNFQVGANAGQTIAVNVGSAATKDLGTGEQSALTAKGNSSSIAEGDLVINGVAIRGSSASDDLASYPASSKASSAIAKAAAINASSADTGVTAQADVNVKGGASMTTATANLAGNTPGIGTFSINGVQTSSISLTSDLATNRAAVAQAINAVKGQTGVEAVDTGDDAQGVKLVASDGRNITVSSSETSGLFDASLTGVAVSSSTRRGTNAVDTSPLTAAGPPPVGGSLAVAVADNARGVVTLNGVNTQEITLTADAAANQKDVISKINAISDKTGIVATADSGAGHEFGVKLTAADGREINASLTQTHSDNAATTAGFTSFVDSAVGLDTSGGGKTANLDAAASETTTYGSYTLSSEKDIKVAAGTSTTANVANAGLTSGTYGPKVAYTSTTSNNGLSMASGDVKINGVNIGESKSTYDTFSRYSDSVSTADAASRTAASAIAKVAAFNAVSDQTGVTAKVNINSLNGADMSTGAAGTGSITINGVTTSTIAVSASNTGTATDATTAGQNRATVIAAINAIKDQTGVEAVDSNSLDGGVKLIAADGRNIDVQFNNGINSANSGISSGAADTVVTGDTSNGGGVAATFSAALDFTMNGVHINSGGIVMTSINDAQDFINTYTSQTGVTASINGANLVFTASDGVGINLGADLDATDDIGVLAAQTTKGSSETTFGTYTMSSSSTFTVDKGTTANIDNSGLAVGSYGSGKTGSELSKLDISTVEGAQKAIVAIDNALQQVDSNQANLGAIQNRFTSTISALQSTSTNLTAARSRIQDADFASETASLSRAQVLQQAGTAMLAQANASSQNVLSLLR